MPRHHEIPVSSRLFVLVSFLLRKVLGNLSRQEEDHSCCDVDDCRCDPTRFLIGHLEEKGHAGDAPELSDHVQMDSGLSTVCIVLDEQKRQERV